MLMAYNFHGSWDSRTGHNAPLLGDVFSVEGAIGLWKQRGLTESKMALGLPFYAQAWNSSATNVNQPGIGQGPIAYRNIPTGITLGFDSVAQTSFGYGNGMFYGLDTPDSLKKKVQYACSKNIPAVMVWELSQDTSANLLINAVSSEANKCFGGPNTPSSSVPPNTPGETPNTPGETPNTPGETPNTP